MYRVLFCLIIFLVSRVFVKFYFFKLIQLSAKFTNSTNSQKSGPGTGLMGIRMRTRAHMNLSFQLIPN